ncbi:SpvB/TcaC N-terminal domain-containing protein, partial [Flavobacterium psychrophilum]|uniref:SpvB/TcaC N-terminal domain-containing protein n=2 Tax=Flavobacterium psychrophilum TaxID=96345 RepID=UPI003393991D
MKNKYLIVLCFASLFLFAINHTLPHLVFKTKNNLTTDKKNQLNFVKENLASTIVLKEFKSDISLGNIGVSSNLSYDEAYDNVFHVSVNELPKNEEQAFLQYELYGYAFSESISRSVNNQPSIGGKFISKKLDWTLQEELLSEKSIKKGNNVILFTSPELDSYAYKIKKLKIIYKKIKQANQYTFLKHNNKLYVKGIIAAATKALSVGGVTINTSQPEFEIELKSNSIGIEIVEQNKTGTIKSQFIPEDKFTEVSQYFALADANQKTVKKITKLFGGVIAYKGFNASFLKGAVKTDKIISVRGLRYNDIAPLNSSMVNLTDEFAGYRLLPHGSKFNNLASITLQYNKKLIPEGYTEKDINVFYFDEMKRLWKEVPKDTLLTKNSQIIAKTNHFTDFIAGIIKLPESPETSGYTPTSIKDLKAASPLVAISSINPPSANTNGTANTNFPIELPAGRAGMQPALALQYSSEGAHTWAGLGWDISVPSVSIETRWGAPRYDQAKETESYNLAGQDLLPNAHRDSWKLREANKKFFPRKEGAFQKITRKGSSPSTYYWEVIDKSGVISYYGGTTTGLDENGVLRTQAGNIGHWALLQQTNLRGNSIHYEYDKINGQLYIKKIYYTGKNNTKGLYSVSFIKDSDLGEAQRPDVQVSARSGFKQVNDKLLRKIIVKYKEEKIRSYQLNYALGAFKKTLLKEISVYDSKDALFYTNKMDYFDDVRDAAGNYVPFGEAQTWSVQNDGLTHGIFGISDINYSGHHTMVSSSSGNNQSVNYSLGVGLSLNSGSFKGNTVGGHGGNSWGKSEIAILLEDLDGDQLPDKVFKKDGKVYYRKNLSYLGQNAFGNLQEINISNVGITKSKSFSWGADLTLSYGASLKLGYDEQYGTNKTKSYFMDFNGDGLVDFADKGQVFYNRLVAGLPTFVANSTGTPSPVSNFGSLQITGSSNITDTNEILRKNPLHDIVRMWEAPVTGNISINHTYKLLENTSLERQQYKDNRNNDKADGVHLYFQKSGQLIWDEIINASDYSLKNKIDNSISVNKGDKLYFRVSSIKDGNYDVINWDPIITYNSVKHFERTASGIQTTSNPISVTTTDVNSYSLKEYKINTDFHSSTAGFLVAPSATNLSIDGFLNKPITSDHITLKVIKKLAAPATTETVVFQKQFLANEVINFNFSSIPAISMEALSGLRIALETQTNINWHTVSLNPTVQMPAGLNQPLETKKLEVSHQLYRKREGNYVINGTTVNFDPINKLDLSLNPADLNLNSSLSIPFSQIAEYNGDVVYTAKQNNKIVARVRYRLTNGTLNLNPYITGADSNPNNYNTVLKNVPIHLELFVSNTKILQLIKNYPNANTLEINMKMQYLALDGSGNQQTVNWNSSTDDYAIYSELEYKESQFGQFYRNWGSFSVNGTIVNSNTLNEALLKPSDAFQDNGNNNPDLSNAPDPNAGIYEVTNAYFIRNIPVFSKNSWYGLEELIYIKDIEMGSSRLGEDDITEYLDFSIPEVQGESTVALEMINESKSKSTSAGLGFGPANAGASQSNGDTYVTQTMSDFNGDRFPDYVRNEAVQFTTPLGGISDQITNIGGFSHSQTYSRGGNAGASYSHGKAAGSLQLTVSKGKVVIASAQNSASDDAKKGANAVSLSGNIGEGYDHSQSIFSDINGDGLADKISDNGEVRLSSGYSYLGSENWGINNINSGTSKDWGAGLGYSMLSGSFSEGGSYSRSESNSEYSLMDINSDGLADKVQYTDTQTFVSLNMGNYFDAPIPYPRYAKMHANQSISYGLSRGFSLEIPLFVVRLVTGFGGGAGWSTNRSEATYADINGDGDIDYVLSEKEDNLVVRLSNIKRTNKLKAVTNATGNSFTLNYELKPTSYENSGAKWVLQQVNLFDGHTGDGVDNLVSRFVYENPNYDRRERDFYGYAKVSQQQINTTDNTVYTTAVQEFYNNDYFRKNLLKTSYVLDSNNQKIQESTVNYAIVNADTNTSINETVLTQPLADGLRVFIAPIHTQERMYENGEYLEKNTYNQYDNKGNIIKFTDNGNGTVNDKVTAIISYHQSDTPYYGGIPKQIEVYTNQGLKRKRTTTLNTATAEVTQCKMYANANQVAITDIEYDIYGNLKKITAPTNYKGQRASLEYTFDTEVFSHITEIKDVFGYSNKMQYDYRFNTPLKTTDRNDQSTEYTLDDKGRVDKIRGPYEIASGKPYTIAYQYFPFATVPYAKTSNYDPEYNQDIETFTYTDGLGRALQVKKTASLFAGNGMPDIESHIVSGKIVYDALGRVIENYYPITSAASNSFVTATSLITPTKTQYDNKNRPVKVTLPDNSTNTTAFKIDNFNGVPTLLTTQTDALGKQIISHNDVMGRNIASVQNSSTGQLVTQFEINALGETSKVTDAAGNISQSTYDWLGRRLEYIHPDAGTTKLEYDLAGNLTKRITSQIKQNVPNGAIQYQYDYNRLNAIQYPKNPQNNVTYHYGKADGSVARRGRLWLVQDASGGQEFFYGKLGEVEKEIRTLRITPIDNQTYITQYEYDTWNRIQKMVYPDGEELDYKYNKAGNLLAMQGKKENKTYNYIKQLGYDTFEQRQYLQY